MNYEVEIEGVEWETFDDPTEAGEWIAEQLSEIEPACYVINITKEDEPDGKED